MRRSRRAAVALGLLVLTTVMLGLGSGCSGMFAYAPPAADTATTFPQRPPRPTDHTELLAQDLGSPQTGTDAANALLRALERAGYSSFSWYDAKGGFALMTNFEAIHDDGRPYDQLARWGVRYRLPHDWLPLLTKIFIPSATRLRLFAFLVTDQSPLVFQADDTEFMTIDWMHRNARLDRPDPLDDPYTQKHHCYVLVYEFAVVGGPELSPGQPNASFVSANSSQAHVSAKQHLFASGILGALRDKP